MRRFLPLTLILAGLALPGLADAPPSGGGAPVGSVTTAGPAGVYVVTVNAPRGVRVHQTPTSVTFDWSGVDPSPTPTPEPGPTPDPGPTPTPVWGPVARVIVLYESSTLTGREPFCSQDCRVSLDTMPKDSKGLPSWRIWDKDVSNNLPEWSDALAKAKADFGASTEPKLYAFDTSGRMKVEPIPASMTTSQFNLLVGGLK